MKLKDIQTYLRLKEELDNLCYSIFSYVKEKYVKQLEFDKYSIYDRYYITQIGIYVEYHDYGYGLVDSAILPTIPFELLESESSWKQFLDNYYKKKIEGQVKSGEE